MQQMLTLLAFRLPDPWLPWLHEALNAFTVCYGICDTAHNSILMRIS